MTGHDRQPWDVAVVGAGPAGASAALATLAQNPGARVLLLDRAAFPRDKACGDGIAPHVLDVLSGLGAGDVVDGWAPLPWMDLSRADRRVEGRLTRPVWVVPREVFDARATVSLPPSFAAWTAPFPPADSSRRHGIGATRASR